MTDTCKILIVYHSRLGAVKKMARLIARGVESEAGCSAEIRSVEELVERDQPASNELDASVALEDLHNCDGLILGSPTRFGNMSAAMKQFIDSTSSEWLAGTLSGSQQRCLHPVRRCMAAKNLLYCRCSTHCFTTAC